MWGRKRAAEKARGKGRFNNDFSLWTSDRCVLKSTNKDRWMRQNGIKYYTFPLSAAVEGIMCGVVYVESHARCAHEATSEHTHIGLKRTFVNGGGGGGGATCGRSERREKLLRAATR